MVYKQSPLHAALQQRNMAAVEAILGAAASLDDEGAIVRVLRDGARVGFAFGLSLKTSSPLAAAVESRGANPGGAASPPPRGAAGGAKKQLREQASAADMVALLMSTIPGGGAPSALLTAGVTYGPFGGSLVAISPLGLAFAHGDVASAAALLRAGHPHDDATSCGSIMLYGALSPLPVPRLMRCSRLAASGRGGSTVGAAALLAAWKEHVAMEAADRVAVLLAANRGEDEQHTSQGHPSEGEQQQPAPAMPSKEAQLLAAEADAAAEADLRLRVAASLAKARDTLASVGDSGGGALNSGAAAHLDADVSASSVAALEAAASALAAARRQAERTAAEVRAAAARVAAETAAEEAASRRAAAQQAAATARMQRQQARERAARAEGRAVDAEEGDSGGGGGTVFDGTEPWMTATDESGGDAALNAFYDVGTDEL
jgi:hypothetical protein